MSTLPVAHGWGPGLAGLRHGIYSLPPAYAGGQSAMTAPCFRIAAKMEFIRKSRGAQHPEGRSPFLVYAPSRDGRCDGSFSTVDHSGTGRLV